MQRTECTSNNIMVMQQANPNAYTHAYFPGSGAARYTVLFDTLLAQLTPKETEAVLAHEIGHLKLKHLAKRITLMLVLSFAFFALLGFLKNQPWFYNGLGMDSTHQNAVALILFMLVVPLFTFLLSPLTSYMSRRHTLVADAFAVQYVHPRDLTSALVKIHGSFATTLTPDPLYCVFYELNPPVMMRIDKLKQ
jgi:STE24 endopeptidase